MITVDSDGENLSYSEMLRRAKSLRKAEERSISGGGRHKQTAVSVEEARTEKLGKEVLEEARITREAMNKRIKACQLDFSTAPVVSTAESATGSSSRFPRVDYNNIFSLEDLKNLGVYDKLESTTHDSKASSNPRQPSCVLDNPLPPSRFSAASTSSERGRLCAPTFADFVGSINFLCCSVARSSPADRDPSQGDSELERRLRMWGSGFLGAANLHGELDGVRRGTTGEDWPRRPPSAMSAASTPTAGGRNSKRAEELFAAAAPAPIVRAAAPVLTDFVSDDAAASAAAAAAADAAIPDYVEYYGDDSGSDSDESDEGRSEVWGEGFADAAARGASPRAIEVPTDVTPRRGGVSKSWPSRRMRDAVGAAEESCGRTRFSQSKRRPNVSASHLLHHCWFD